MNDTSLLVNTSIPAQCSPVEDKFAAAKLLNFSLTICLSLFGLASNTLVVLVYRKTKVLSSTDVYLTALAISDNVQIASLNLYAYRYVYQLLFPGINDWRASGLVALIGILITTMSHFVNTYIIVLLGIDRFLQIKRLSLSKTWCRARRARLLLAILIASAMVFCVPRWFEYVPLMIHYKQSVSRCEGYYLVTHGIGQDENYELVYSFIIYLLVMYFIPLCLLSFTSSTLISAIYKRARWLRKIQSEMFHPSNKARLNKTEINAITTLIILTISFIFFQIPDMVLQFIWRLAPEHGPTASIFSYQITILNSSINFIIYAVNSNAFRKRLYKVFGCLATDADGPEVTMLGAHRTNPTLNSNPSKPSIATVS